MDSTKVGKWESERVGGSTTRWPAVGALRRGTVAQGPWRGGRMRREPALCFIISERGQAERDGWIDG